MRAHVVGASITTMAQVLGVIDRYRGVTYDNTRAKQPERYRIVEEKLNALREKAEGRRK